MSLWEQILAATQGDLSAEEAKVLRTAGTKVLWRFWLAFYSAWGLGALGIVGLTGWVSAQEVDKQITIRTRPLAVAVAQLTSTVNDLKTAATEQTLQLLRVAIVDSQVKKCHAPKEETKAIYRAQLVEAQDRYYKLTGQYYPQPSCADL